MCVAQKTSTWSRIVHFFYHSAPLRQKPLTVIQTILQGSLTLTLCLKNTLYLCRVDVNLRSSFGCDNFMQSQVTTVVQNQRQFFPRADAILSAFGQIMLN